MDSTVTQIVAGVVAVLVPAIVKILTDWSENMKAQAAPAPAAAAPASHPPPPPEPRNVDSDKLN